MKRSVAFDPNFKNRNKGRRKGNVSVDVASTNLTGSLTFYNTPTPPDGGYIIVSDSNAAKGIAAASAKPVFWTATDATLVTTVNGLPGNNNTFTTTAQAFSYLASNNYYVIAPNTNNIVTSGLILEVNAKSKNSYPTTGTTWYDLSGNGNNGTLTNGPSFNSDGYIVFDGSNDVVTIPNSTSLNPTTGLTIESWVKFDTNSDDFIFEKGNVNTQFSLFSHGSDIVFRTYHSGDGGYHTQSPSKTSVGIVNGQWHHIVGSWDGSTKRIYIDGVLKNSVSKSGNLVTTSPGASIGRFGGTTSGYYFNGGIAAVRVYNRGLSESEILQNYYKGNIVTRNLQQHYDFGNIVCKADNGSTVRNLANNTQTAPMTNTGNDISYSNSEGYLEWAGSNSAYLDIPDAGTLSNFTLSAWVYNKSGGDGRHSLLRNYWEIVGTSLQFWSYAFDNDYWRSTPSGAVPYDTWTYITTTWDGTRIRHYINGQLYWTDSAASGGTGESWYWIAGYGGRKFKGRLATLSIYNDDLSASEILQNYEAHRVRFSL